MSNGNWKFPAPRLLSLAVLAGVIAGAIAVYVMGGADGNKATASLSTENVGASCSAKAERAQMVGKAAIGDVAAMLPADPPQSLNMIAFNDPDGQPISVADFAGKITLINLWATWCTPCREEMPALDALESEMGSDGFEVVAVNVDRGDDEKPKAFLAETGIETLGYYRDNTMGIFNELKKRGLALGLPVTLLVDEEGCLLAHMNGPAEWAGEDAKRLIEAAMGAEEGV